MMDFLNERNKSRFLNIDDEMVNMCSDDLADLNDFLGADEDDINAVDEDIEKFKEEEEETE